MSLSQEEIARQAEQSQRLAAAVAFEFGPPILQGLARESWDAIRELTDLACACIDRVEQDLREGRTLQQIQEAAPASVRYKAFLKAVLHSAREREGESHARV